MAAVIVITGDILAVADGARFITGLNVISLTILILGDSTSFSQLA